MTTKGISRTNARTMWTACAWLVLTAVLLSACGSAGQPKVYRVGILSGLSFIADISDGFKAEMTELGYVEGENIVYDIQTTDFDMVAYRGALDKFVQDKVDLIVVFPTEASLEARAATEGTGIPVLFTYAIIEGMGIVDDTRNPGGNITGVRYPGTDIALKRFELLLRLAPDAKRVVVPYQRGYPIVGPQLDALHLTAAAAGVTLVEAPADNAAQLQAFFDGQANQEPFDAVLMIVEPLAVTPEPFEVMARYAYENEILIGGAMMTAGGYESVFDVGVKSYDAGVLAAPLADKIFKGVEVGGIPVVSSESYMIINYKAAKVLGVSIPEGLLAQANQIIR
jgi:putative ABC transport system substrate-binding protein